MGPTDSFASNEGRGTAGTGCERGCPSECRSRPGTQDRLALPAYGLATPSIWGMLVVIAKVDIRADHSLLLLLVIFQILELHRLPVRLRLVRIHRHLRDLVHHLLLSTILSRCSALAVLFLVVVQYPRGLV
jgi:hypothetical protein